MRRHPYLKPGIMRMFLLLPLMLLYCLSAFAQINIKGTIRSDAGDPVPFASVMVKGTRTATSAGADGIFSLVVAQLPVTLVFSAAGYVNREYEVTKDKDFRKLTIVLRASREELSEVVVTAGLEMSRSPALAMSSSRASIDVSPVDMAKHEYKAAAYKKKDFAAKESNRTSYSRILTAGELSDFKKWKLWGDYSAADFSKYSEHWKLSFLRRYCVQVQNSERKVAIGEKVFLIDRIKHDTVWAAITDNTGKAELWSDAGDEQSDLAIYCAGEFLDEPVLFEKGINRMRLKKGCHVSNDVDICFVVDATGSMGDEISYLQSELNEIISSTATDHREVQLHLSSVFYRDVRDEYLTRDLAFTSDASSLVKFINEQRAGGGGDFPEAVEDALTVALEKLEWTEGARARILFLVLDAPPHDAAKERMSVLIRKAAAMGVRIVPIACSGVNKSTEYLMRCAALATNGSYVFLTDDSGVGNPHIKPTTDEFKVELLSDLLKRLLGEMIAANACDAKPATTITKDTTEQLVKLTIYPNPTTGRVVLESTTSLKEVVITDFTGKLLSRLDTRDRKRRWVIHLSNNPSGTYLVRYFTENGGWGSEKIVLLH